MSEATHKEMYVCLEFNEKIEQEFFKKPNLFFNIANLHKKKPLVQLGNYLFQGAYEDTVGSRLFFKEIDQEPVRDVFQKKTPIHLEYFAKTTKCISLKWLKIPEQITQVEPSETVDLNLDQDYKLTIKKLKENSLDINDLINRPEDPVKVEIIPEENKSNLVIDDDLEEIIEEQTLEVIGEETPQETENLLDLLQKAARVPTRRKKQGEMIVQPKEEHLVNVSETKNFLVLKQLYLQNLSYKDVCGKIDLNKFRDYVDVEASIREKVIKSKEELTENDKNLLVSMKNFHNLCVPLQLTLLVEQLRLQKELIVNMAEVELEEVDEFGRTAKDRYRLLKTFAKDLWYHLFVRLGSHD